MSRVFKLPDLGEGIHEAEIVDILVKVGDEVQEEQPILVVETDKATVEITSPYSGTVERISVQVDDRVKVGDVLIVFSGEGAAEAVPVAPTAPVEAVSVAVPAPAREGPVPAAPSTRRLARELGVDLRLVPPSGPGGRITGEDVRAFAEGGARPAAPAAVPVAAVPAPVAAVPEVTLRPAEVVAPPLPDFGQWGPIERIALKSVRRSTAKHMALSWSQIPHVNHQDVADITELEELRRRYKEEVEARGGQLTLTVFFLKAAVAALKAYPRFNASLDPDADEIVLKHYYHIGVATDTERGLLVPVLREVDCKGIIDLSKELYELVQRTRRGEAALEDMRGGTFTITNIGALGGTGFSPIVNYPEVAIMGLGRARLQPVVRMGEDGAPGIVPRLLMPIVLAFDHRVVDGAEAARFTNVVIDVLEHPEKLLLLM